MGKVIGPVNQMFCSPYLTYITLLHKLSSSFTYLKSHSISKLLLCAFQVSNAKSTSSFIQHSLGPLHQMKGSLFPITAPQKNSSTSCNIVNCPIYMVLFLQNNLLVKTKCLTFLAQFRRIDPAYSL